MELSELINLKEVEFSVLRNLQKSLSGKGSESDKAEINRECGISRRKISEYQNFISDQARNARWAAR